MNNLEQYIGSLAPSCWLSNQHINGYNVSQPINGDFITEWKDISGNGHHATSINPGIFIDHDSVAITQNNLPAVQASNNNNADSLYKGSEFRIDGILGNSFTCMIIGSCTAYTAFDMAIQIINRFSIYGARDILDINICLGINNNVPIFHDVLLVNIHNLNYVGRYGLQVSTRPFQLRNLLNQIHSFYSLIWTYDDATSTHVIYDQNKEYIRFIGAKPNNNDYSLIVFGNSLDPVETQQSFNKRHGIGQEFSFWNTKRTLSEIKQMQTYIKLKYNI